MNDEKDTRAWMPPPPGKHQLGYQLPTKDGSFLDQLPDFSGLTNDSPWPLRTVAPSANDASTYDSLGMQPYYQTVSFNFSGYRGAILPSDPGAMGEDAGYDGGIAFSADGTASIASFHAEDRSPETRQTEDLFSTLQVAQSRRGSRSTRTSVAGFGDKKFRCTHCAHRSSTRSEFNKHNQRHNKQHICTVPGCLRKEGFGTHNDLVRHKKSCHMEEGHGPMFACSHGDCAKPTPGKPRKFFPRADNFRNHLKKLHKLDITADNDLTQYHYLPSTAAATAAVEEEKHDYNDDRDLRGVGEGPCGAVDLQSLSSDGLAHVPARLLSKDLTESPEQSQEQKEMMDVGMLDDTPNLLQDHTPLNNLAFSSMGAATDTFVHPAALTIGMYQPDSFGFQAMPPPDMARGADISYPPPQELAELFPGPNEGDVDHSPAISLEQDFSAVELPQSSAATTAAAVTTASMGEDGDGDEAMDETGTESSLSLNMSYNSMRENGLDEVAMVKLLKTFPTQLLELALQRDDGSGASSAAAATASSAAEDPQRDRDGPQCQVCHKTFQRPCELKKHIKRHLKPYPCTFKGCHNRRFGSKNDWKRHESSQHETADQQSQTWFCDGSCKQVRFYPTKEAFASHLTQYHGVADMAELHAHISTSVFGGRQDRRFWCGFCADVLDGGDGGSGAWTARCDHIDLHFSGKDGFDQGNMENWRYLEDEPGMEQRKAMLESQVLAPTTASATTSFSSTLSPVRSHGTTTTALLQEDRKRKGGSSPQVRHRAAKR